MNTLQLFQLGIVWGIIFGTLFCVATLLLGWINPAMLLNNYPDDIRTRYGPMSAEVRRQANLASLPLIAALGSVLILALLQLRQATGALALLDTFVVTTIILQLWNLIDLVVLDWFILLILRPAFMILPGTEGMAGYQDYRYHWRKFGNGIVLTLLLSMVISAVAVGLEAIFS